ncbi:MAG: hypothetical protein KF906_12790 [Actinobacteria bacterium]|nr:hypothetical protein [Actinomycetota bacterium]
MASLDRFRPRPVTAFALLTLVIWTTRIPLAWTNDEDTVGEKLVWSTPITLFVVAAATLLVLQARGDGRSPTSTKLARTFAVATIVYWTIRITMIVAGDWSVGFKVVHAVLAVVSSGAAALAWRSLAGTDGTTDRTPATAAA